MFDISKSINKVDNHEKISGKAKYVSDLFFAGQLYAYSIRSTIAKGKIIAKKMPILSEGYHIIDYRDVPGNNYVKMVFDDQVVFPEDKVSYIGEPIMLLIGPDKQEILKLVKQVEIVYEEEEPVFAWTNSAIHYHFDKGEGSLSFANANRIIAYEYETGYQEQAYIEPQGMSGYLDIDKVTLYGSIQCPYYVKNALINCLGVSSDKIRVIQTTVGGAFGGKEEFPSLIACQLAVAIKKIQKPIKIIYEREEDMISTTKRHPSKISIKAAIGDDSNIIAIQTRVAINGGANIGLSGVVLSRAMIAATGAYTIDNLDIEGDVYLTNTVPNGAFRGFGAPQMLFAIEMFIEHVAKDLGVDPLEYRMNYLAKQNDLTSTSGTFWDPIVMPEMIKKALEVSSFKEKAKLYQNNNLFKGIGMSFFLHGCGFTGNGEQTHIKAVVRLKKDEFDVVHILIAAVDMGQGIRTTMRKLVAKVLGIGIEQVTYNLPDTDFVPDSGPTVASRTMMIVGGLVARCAIKLKDNWQKGREQIFEEVYKQPDYIKWDEDKMQGDAYPAYSWGVNVVEVEVDKDTFVVTPTRIWSVYDLGKAIDERVVLGQADGGIAQGIAYGYLEVMENESGKIKQKNLTDYIIPTASDMPPMETYIFDNPYALGPYGAKGVGELTLVGGAPAIAKAIEMAIKHKVTKIPATPEYIMELINHDKN